MSVKDEVLAFLDKALPIVEFGEVTISIKVHQGKVKHISKGILETALPAEEHHGEREET